jgi:uncharacterized protein YhhL (DUF1145 family)
LWSLQVWGSTLCSLLQPPATSYSLGSNILLTTLLSNTLSLCSSLSVRDQVSHSFKTTGKIRVLDILIFKILEWRREDKRFWTGRSQIFFVNSTLICYVVSRFHRINCESVKCDNVQRFVGDIVTSVWLSAVLSFVSPLSIIVVKSRICDMRQCW